MAGARKFIRVKARRATKVSANRDDSVKTTLIPPQVRARVLNVRQRANRVLVGRPDFNRTRRRRNR